jgi:CheY-like chemotaxis protein
MNILERKNILLLEDNDDDAFLTERALSKAGITEKVQRCQDGQVLIDYLSGVPPYENREENPLPHLILMDLKTPRKNGLEVLEWIRDHKKLSPMVVLALTSSSEQRDVERAYQLHVNAYLVKPTSLNAMTEIAHCIKRLWLDRGSTILTSFILPFLLALTFLSGVLK